MSDNASLEESIRAEADKVLGDIRMKEEAEIRKLDEAFASHMKDFRAAREAETKEKIAQETAKIRNRAALELKKANLRFAEELSRQIVDEAMAAIRNDPRYKIFIADSITRVMSRIPGKAELLLGPADRGLKQEIEASITQRKGADITIGEDSSIKWGGCIIRDREGRIFNATLERIYFRKASSIRREVIGILKQKGFVL